MTMTINKQPSWREPGIGFFPEVKCSAGECPWKGVVREGNWIVDFLGANVRRDVQGMFRVPG